MNNYCKGKTGFTLLELLIVIGIIAILAAAVVIAINPARHFMQARNSQRWSDISGLSSALYSNLVDSVGTKDAGVWTNCVQGTSSSTPTDAINCASDLAPDYITAIPSDPQNNSPTRSGYMIYLTPDNRLMVYATPDPTIGITDNFSGIQILH